MKNAIVYIVCFVIVFGVGFGVYLGYTNHKEAIEFDDLSVGYAYVDSKGVFIGNFSSKDEYMLICGFEHEIKGDTMYITLYQTTNDDKALERGKDNYTKIEIPDCKSVKKLYYRYNDEKDKIKLGN